MQKTLCKLWDSLTF